MAKEGDEVLTITKKIHTCDVCEKSFDSGKALGGHVSSTHVQAANKYNLSPKILETIIMGKEASSFSSSSSFSFICKECGKGFPSTKSLSGHMSCHSERAKRERVQKSMEPPSDGTEIGKAVVDLSSCFNVCWPVKAKRGRGAINHPRDAVDSDSEDSIEFLYNNAVQQLVRLKKLKEKAKCLTSASKKFKNAMDLSDEVQTNQGCEYTCGTCKKSFPTYQALGGHRSSHSKNLMKVNIFNTIDEHTDEQVQNHEDELYANTNKSGSSIGSELALDQVRYSSQQVISADENTEQTIAGKVLLDLHLNEVSNYWKDEDGMIQFKNAGGN